MRPRNRIYHQPSNKVWECGFVLQFTDAASFQNVILVHPCQHVYWVGLGCAASTKVNIKQMEHSVVKEKTTWQPENYLCVGLFRFQKHYVYNG